MEGVRKIHPGAGRSWWNSSSYTSARGAGSTLPIPEGFWRPFTVPGVRPVTVTLALRTLWPRFPQIPTTGTEFVLPSSRSTVTRVTAAPRKGHPRLCPVRFPALGSSRREPHVGLSHSCSPGWRAMGTSAAALPSPSRRKTRPPPNPRVSAWQTQLFLPSPCGETADQLPEAASPGSQVGGRVQGRSRALLDKGEERRG